MLVALEFPFADARPFLPTATNRVPPQDWLLAQPYRDFVRGFGTLRERRRGGVQQWAGEEIFCACDSALKLDQSLQDLVRQLGPLALYPYCAFRRLLTNGTSVARYEIGIGYRYRDRRRFRPLQARESLGLLEAALKLRVKLPGTKNGNAVDFGSSSGQVARYYLRSTTRLSGGTPDPTEAWWVTPGAPLILVEYAQEEVGSLPEYSRPVSTAAGLTLSLSHCRVSYGRAELGAWFIGYSAGTDRTQLRNLRVNLVRLHSERQCLRSILRLIAQERIPVVRGSPATEALQLYLRDATRWMKQQTRNGFEQSSLLEAARDSEDFISPGERESLLSRLSTIRKNISRSVEDLATAEGGVAAGKIHILGSGNTVLVGTHLSAGSTTMSQYDIQIGDHATFHGDFVVAESIQNSFNRVKDAKVDAGLKEALTELTKQVAELTQQLPAEQARSVSRDLENLSTEATSAAPRRKWWELSAEGIKEAAKTLGDAAGPILATVAKVVAFLA